MASDYRVLARFDGDGSGFMRAVNAMEARAGRFANVMRNNLGNKLAGIFSLGALGYQFRRTIEFASNLTDISSRTGRSVEQLQQLNAVLVQNGASLENLVAFWERLDRAREGALSNPTGQQAAAFASLGISSDSLKTQSSADITTAIAAKLKGGNIEKYIAALQEVGGRGVGKLVASFRAGLGQMDSDVRVMSTNTAAALDALDDAFAGLNQELAVALGPSILYIVKGIKVLVSGLTLWANAFAAFYQTIASVFSTQSLAETSEIAWASISDLKKDYAKLVEEVLKPIAPNAITGADTDRGPLTFAPIQQVNQTGSAPTSDALLAVGNFLGSGRLGLQALASKQVQLLDAIKSNTQKIADRPADADGLTN